MPDRARSCGLRRCSAGIAAAAALLLAPVAHAGLGDRLDHFVPSPSGNGRGLTLKAGSTIAYYSTEGGENVIYLVDLKTHAAAGSLTTDLGALAPGRSFGTLAWDAAGSVLWAAEYAAASGYVDRIDPSTGGVTRAFDAVDLDPANTGIDGLAVDADGSLWLSGDGLGLASTTVYHVSPAGAALGSFSVPFGNSGIALDGDHLWLADIDNRAVHRYTKAGADTGVSFPTPDVNPESLAVDRCTFTGKKALWTYSAGFSGAELAAYELDVSDNAGCPAAQPEPSPAPKPVPKPTPKPTPTPPAAAAIKVGGGSGSGPVAAGRSVGLDATSPADPGGTRLVYVWDFGDGTKPARAPGRVGHRFHCAGTYRVEVIVTAAAGARRTLRRTIVVAFPRSATKAFAGVTLRPRASVTRRTLSVTLVTGRVPFQGKRATLGPVEFWIDGVGARAAPRPGARFLITRHRRHALRITVRFQGTRATRTITACFFA